MNNIEALFGEPKFKVGDVLLVPTKEYSGEVVSVESYCTRRGDFFYMYQLRFDSPDKRNCTYKESDLMKSDQYKMSNV